MGKTTTTDVAAFIDALDHPLTPVIRALRALLLAVDPSIAEAVKWNASSFRTSGHFATMQLRRPDVVRLVLHLGAKKGGLPAGAIADPDGLLAWLAPDRALLEFRDAAELEARQAAVVALVRQGMALLP
ncbi:DUF1801 domain-containing protein [Stenotrophomonas acidaminiphila]